MMKILEPAMTDNKVLAIHPDKTKQGVRIAESKYDQMRAAIVGAFGDADELGYQEAVARVRKALTGKFDGSIEWYFNAVKHDLEARKILVRATKSSPVRYRLDRAALKKQS
jgi:hypothetical protein